MIKLIKNAIYEKLSTVCADVHYQSNEQDENNRGSQFPLITFHRIGGKVIKGGKRSEMFQITARHTTNMECEELRNKVIELLNHTRNGEHWERCEMQPMGPDLRDPTSGANGIPMTFVFIMKDFAI